MINDEIEIWFFVFFFILFYFGERQITAVWDPVLES
jgi:hypothetical protein